MAATILHIAYYHNSHTAHSIGILLAQYLYCLRIVPISKLCIHSMHIACSSHTESNIAMHSACLEPDYTGWPFHWNKKETSNPNWPTTFSFAKIYQAFLYQTFKKFQNAPWIFLIAAGLCPSPVATASNFDPSQWQCIAEVPCAMCP